MPLKLNIQHFAEGADEEFDLDAIMDEWEKSFEDSDTDADTDTETDDEIEDGEEDFVEGDEEENTNDSDDDTSDDSDDDTPDDDNTDVPPRNDTPEGNGRWKELRQQAEEAQRLRSVLDQIAQANGLTDATQLVQQIQERQLELDAEQQGVPVDVLKRINDLESQNINARREAVAAALDRDIKEISQQYGVKENDPSIQAAFNLIAAKGWVDEHQLPTVDFKDAYFLANKDLIAKKEVDALRQKELSEKKKRQDAALPVNPSGNSDTQNVVDDEKIAEMVRKDLEDYI